MVLGDPRVKIELARVAMEKGAWVAVEAYVDDLRSSLEGREIPGGSESLFQGWHEHLRAVAGEAAGRGDVWRVREARAKARPDLLGAREAEAERARWAEIEIRAWLAFPPAAAPAAAEGAGRDEFSAVERMVAEDLKLAFTGKREALQREVALHILAHRAWPAWERGTEMAAAPGAGDPPRVPGPDIAGWLALARRAWPQVEDEKNYQRLHARIEDLRGAPEKVVAWLLGDRGWTPEKPIPKARVDDLGKKDRLLLARALGWWGDLRHREAAGTEAMALWQGAWNVYQTVFEADPEFPEELAAAARREGVKTALLTRGNETALRVLDDYLALRRGDAEAVRLRNDLLARFTLETPAKMAELGYRTVAIPGGAFRTGSEQARAEVEERPFPSGEAVRVRVLPARTCLLQDFLAGVREVTTAQYRAYLDAMKDPERARLWRHPREPAEKSQPGARDIPAGLTLSPDEPVRGVDWWDAWACARFLGGRLPTEAEWEKAARWNGRLLPAEDPYPSWRRSIGETQWAGFWPDHGLDLSPFDLAPSGARGFLGGVAEWTMDPFEVRVPGVPEATVPSVAEVPPDVADGTVLMAVRGASFFHPAPGEPAGPSLAEKKEPPPAAGGKEGEKGAAPAPAPRTWRAMDLLERRGIAAGRKAKWIGFRVVVGSAASERAR